MWEINLGTKYLTERTKCVYWLRGRGTVFGGRRHHFRQISILLYYVTYILLFTLINHNIKSTDRWREEHWLSHYNDTVKRWDTSDSKLAARSVGWCVGSRKNGKCKDLSDERQTVMTESEHLQNCRSHEVFWGLVLTRSGPRKDNRLIYVISWLAGDV